MIITHDNSYISATASELIDRGYGVRTVYAVHFDRHYTAEEKRRNSDLYASMTREEWSKHCDEVAESFAAPMSEILQRFIGKYDIHQVSPETSTMAHFRSNWDLYFNSTRLRGHDNESRFESFRLTFNGYRTPEENAKLLEEVLKIVEDLEYKNIACRVQYTAYLYDGKIEEAAASAYKKIEGKFVDCFYDRGRVRIVGEHDGKTLYGFFRKGAKKKYLAMTGAEVLAMTFL